MATKKTETEAVAAEEKPKRRGRPPKAAAEGAATPKTQKATKAAKEAAAKAAPAADAEAAEAPAPKRRGRKPKALVEAEKAAAAAAEAEKATAAKQFEAPSAESAQSSEAQAGEAHADKRRARRNPTKIKNAEATVAPAPRREEAPAFDAQRGYGHQRNNNNNNNNNGYRQNNNNGNNRHQRRQRNREVEPSVTREELAALKVAELRARAEQLEVDAANLKKAELVDAVYEAAVRAEGFRDVEGVLDIHSDGYGFLRTSGYLPSEHDCYVPGSLIKRNGLRKGDYLKATTRPARDNEKFAAIQKISSVNDMPLEELAGRPRFADLTPVFPQERLTMEHGKNTLTARVIDLVAPIGKGQRGLIVSPPKAGKTTILKDMAAAISANNPEVHLMCLLIDERPEEVTDMERSIQGEVISSTFDMPADNHIAAAEMVIERAKRLVEQGKDVVILLDSITRLARAYNLAQPASGRVLSGGVDSTALYPPKRFLGAARNIENGGSLTILASALIETGSKMDEVIFEEFKGTGNMELRLDRQLADRRIFPAIDPIASGTRKEELLLDSQMTPIIWAVRRILANMNNTERSMDMLLKSVKQTDDNEEFLLRMARKAQHGKTENLEL